MKIPALALLASLPCGASTYLLGLYGDPNQNYTFVASSDGKSHTEPVAPYPGHIDSTDYGLICMAFLKGANWNTNYTGSIHAPTSAIELETAYLAFRLALFHAAHAPISQYGPISMAMWQLNDPTPGDVPRDPAAQPWVKLAEHYFSIGLLTTDKFPNTIVWVPDNQTIQPFMNAVPGVNLPIPEPRTITFIGCGLLLIFAGLRRR